MSLSAHNSQSYIGSSSRDKSPVLPFSIPLRRICSINPKKPMYIDPNEEVVFLPMKSVKTNGNVDYTIRKKCYEVGSGFTFFRKNDILMAKITPCFENKKIALLEKMDTSYGFGSTEYHVLRPLDSIDKRYLLYILRSFEFVSMGEKNMIGSAGQKRVPVNFLSNYQIPFYDIITQKCIGRYLDYKNYQINKYIRIKKRQIELLKELKQTIINDVVTGKIDVRTGKPYPKYKDSGVDWLGMIPEEWQQSAMSKVCSLIVDGTHFSPKSFDSGDYMYITAKNIKEQGVDLSDVSYIRAVDHEPIYSRCPVEKGDVLYIKDGATAGIATINDIEEQFSLLSSVALIRPLCNIEPKYLVYYLNSMVFKSHLLSYLTGGAMTRFTIDKLKRYIVLYPDTDVQHEILTYLVAHSERINRKIDIMKRSIALLSELQTRLISDAVTGKLDVRDVEIPDFEEENEFPDGEVEDKPYTEEDEHVQD